MHLHFAKLLHQRGEGKPPRGWGLGGPKNFAGKIFAGREIFVGAGREAMICSAVLIQYTRVTDGRTDGIGVAYTRYSIMLSRVKNRRWRTAAMYFKYLNCHKSGSVLDSDIMFGSSVGFSGKADPMVKLSFFFKNPRWRLAAILNKQQWP